MTDQQEIIREGVRSPTEGEMQWKTVEKQKEKLGEALKITMTGHLTGKNGKILEMGKEIMSVCDQAGIKADMRCSLAKVLLEAAKASEEKEEKLRKELDGANILEKRGVKDRIKEEEERRARLAVWGISCQGLEHWMREPVEEEGKLRPDCLPHPQPTAPLFSACPPPYFGNYPMLSIKDGSMENEDGVVLRLTGGQAECEYEEQHRPKPQQQMITIEPEKTEPPAAQVQTHVDHKEEEDEEGEEERSSAAGATARSPPELLAGEAERLVEMLRKRLEEEELTEKFKKQKGVAEGKAVPPSDVRKKVHLKVHIPKVRGVDSWDGWIQGTLEEDIDECSVLQSAGGDEDDSRRRHAFGSRKEREEMEEQWLQSGGMRGEHPMLRRSQMTAAENPQKGVMGHSNYALEMPLVVTAGGERRYKPYGVGDVTALVQMLPPIIDGGAGWLRQLDKVTSGTQLALGDFRAIAGRCMTVTALEEIQVLAAVITRPDSTSFFRVQEQIGNAVRQQYPTPNAAAITKLEWKPDQNPRDYVEQVKEVDAEHRLQSFCTWSSPGVV
ncbi:uncharacterized protein LOC112842822 isoform X1 [Oreochromis niloticus]|uniref:uncharacterized protein LOC112842822 isoform X1 n=1 Tax=Oreochromis niloticus TaxID=8128 RepID=UPI000DF3C1AD|nr:uncharacterized protein LOC112842822 isoform X1 [Oreochromis niloticus]